MKYSFLFLLFIGIASCTNAQESREKQKHNTVSDNKLIEESKYPDIIIEKGLQEMYDSSKWCTYLYYCIDTPKSEDGTYKYKIPKPLSSYALKFDSVYNNKDTFICFFYFINEDSISSNMIKNSLSAICVVKDPNYRCTYSRTVVGLEPSKICIRRVINDKTNNKHSLSINKKESSKRTIEEKLFDPITPEIITFIDHNRTALNPWFVAQAKKRGIIK